MLPAHDRPALAAAPRLTRSRRPQAIGMMDPAFFVGRRAIIDWLNSSFLLNREATAAATASAAAAATAAAGGASCR